MTVKQFFKSNVFKCIATLLCVLLVCGVFLTIMNGLLEVTDEERFDRAMAKIYGKTVTTEALTPADYNSNATIEAAYRVKEDGNFLVKSTGKGGFAGTVTCWVVVEVNNSGISGIMKVVVDSYVGETQMAEIKDSFLQKFSTGYQDGIIYSTADGYLVTGSTRSSNAICNAVNGALDYVNAMFGNVKTAGEILLTEFAKIYGDKEISVYGCDADGNDVLITMESKTADGFSANNATVGNANVIEYYKVTYMDGDNKVLQYVATSTGKGGYENGTVTCRVAINVVGGKLTTIGSVTVIDSFKQSWIDKIDYLDKFAGTDVSGDGFAISKDDGFVTAGTSMASNAINNSVNGAIDYLKTLELSAPADEPVDGGDNNE